MAVTSDPYTNSDAVAVISEVWPGMMNEALFAKTVAANFFTDLSSYVSAGSDIIHVPDIYTNVFSVQTQGTQGAEITTESVATVDVTLTVNLHKYVSFLMGRLTLNQIASQYDLTGAYVREATNLLKDALEDSLFGLWSSLTTNTVGDTATILTDAEIRQAIEKMDTANFPLGELAFFFHSYVFWNQLAAITKYYDSSINGSASFVRDGNFGPMDRICFFERSSGSSDIPKPSCSPTSIRIRRSDRWRFCKSYYHLGEQKLGTAYQCRNHLRSSSASRASSSSFERFQLIHQLIMLT
jgi:hypothetical protein